MFSVEKENKKTGAYLKKLIEKKYPSHRKFCREYLIAAGVDPNDEELRKMGNRISQIIKGAKAIQTYDLPFFSDLLGVSCEEILSCGKTFVPISGHVTNYEIAFSNDPRIWKKYVERSDKMILNADEYNKTVIDYAFEFRNYPFLRFLVENGYIWFIDDSQKQSYDFRCGFSAGTSIKRRDVGSIDTDLENELNYHSEEKGLRQSMIALALENRDFDLLSSFKARQIPALGQMLIVPYNHQPRAHDFYREEVIDAILDSDDKVFEYFSEEFTISDPKGREYTFIYPFLHELIDRMTAVRHRCTETVIRRAIEHNGEVCRTLQRMVDEAAQCVCDQCGRIAFLNEEQITGEVLHYYEFGEQDGFVSYMFPKSKQEYSFLYSNVICASETAESVPFQPLLDELNRTFEAVRSIRPVIPEMEKYRKETESETV